MVGAIDGVGTKLEIAQVMEKHDTVGIDLVAMNVNDLVVQGAEPLMFLDYYGCSKLDSAMAASFVEGVAIGCIDANCALSGGETAEMPGMYKGKDYDAAGAAHGAVFKEHRLPRTDAMAEGDVLLGLASNGVHSNGFSLVRKIIQREQISYNDIAPWDSTTTVGLSLLTPTRIYVRPLLKVISKKLLLGLSHITGGGLTENIPRMLPSHLAAEVDVATWSIPPVFKWLKQAGAIANDEFAKTWNTGIGMVAVVKKEDVEQVISDLEASGEKVYTIGKLVSRSGPGCLLKNTSSWD
jgi:phosphoribosylamine--glycine ligase/phosphoribosylformylglycinamidine cyclo-ligase